MKDKQINKNERTMNQEVKCNPYNNYYYIVWETQQPRWQVFVFYETFCNHF